MDSQKLYQPSLRDEVEKLWEALGGQVGGAFPVDYRDVQAATAQALADIVAMEQEGQDRILEAYEGRIAALERGSGAQNGGPVLTVGTALSGHTGAQVDFLCAGENDHEPIRDAIYQLEKAGGGVLQLLAGDYYFGEHSVALGGMIALQGVESGVVIHYAGDAGSPINIYDGGHNTMKNFTVQIQGTASGCHMMDSDNNIIERVTFIGGDVGLGCRGNNNLITGCVFDGMEVGTGILLAGEGNVVQTCTVGRCGNGIQVEGSKHLISNNVLTNCATGVMIHSCDLTEVCQNKISDCTNGVENNASNNTTAHNQIANCGSGILVNSPLQPVQQDQIKHNTVENCDNGIHVRRARNIYIAYNRCSGNRQGGISIGDGYPEMTLYNNTCDNNEYGIHSHQLQVRFISNTCTANSVSGISMIGDSWALCNRCDNNLYGIHTDDGSPIMLQNQCNGNQVSGIACDAAQRTILVQNTCFNNGHQGLHLGAFALALGNNCAGGNCGIYASGNYAVIQGNICNNHTSYGIRILASHINVSHNECLGNDTFGIASSGDYNTLTNNHCTQYRNGGISASGNYTTIQNNRCQSTLDSDIRQGINYSGSNGHIEGNCCTGQVYGIYSTANDTVILRNECPNCDNCSIHVRGSNVRIVANSCNNNSIRGIYTCDCSDVLVKENVCNNNTDDGIDMGGLYGLTAEGNTVNGNNIGIQIRSVYPSISMRNNKVAGNTQYGLIATSQADISHNTISGSAYGIYQRSALKNTMISNNTITECTQWGIYLEAPEASVTGNICDDCDLGIDIKGSQNLISANTFKNNTVGIRSSGDNMIVTNQLLANRTPLDTQPTDYLELNRVL